MMQQRVKARQQLNKHMSLILALFLYVEISDNVKVCWYQNCRETTRTARKTRYDVRIHHVCRLSNRGRAPGTGNTLANQGPRGNAAAQGHLTKPGIRVPRTSSVRLAGLCDRHNTNVILQHLCLIPLRRNE